jgi:hypothetical protein
MAWLNDYVMWWQSWMIVAVIVAVLIVGFCIRFQMRRWLLPIWFLLVLVTGLHILLTIFAFFVSGGFLAISVFYLALFSWPVPATFVALLFIRPRRPDAHNTA